MTAAFIRIVTALSGSWPIMFSPTVFDIGHVRVAAIDLSAVAPRGSAEADRQTAAVLSARAPRAHASLVDRRG